jgi:hypothetical protein
VANIEKVETIEDGTVRVILRADPGEVTCLEGRMTGVHLFAEGTAHYATTISNRGPGSTRYVLIPRQLREGLPELAKDIPFARMATDTKDFLIITVPKKILG